MLNRRLLRIKIFQALYSFYQTDSPDKTIAYKNLLKSLNKMHELFIRNLRILDKIADIIDERFETNKQKFLKTENDSETLKRLSDNQGIINLRGNTHYQELVNRYKINLSTNMDILKKIARNIEESNRYMEFRQHGNISSDLNVLKHIYKDYIYTDEVLLSELEEMNIHWGHDQYYVGIIMLSCLKKDSFFNIPGNPLPQTFKSIELEETDSDEEFVKILFQKTIEQAAEYESVIIQYLENWEPDRIALSDMIIMRMACAEIIHFDQIPIKASLNEYIELTKTFSTPKSKIFVNGVLDKVISHYNREGIIQKTGRGLQEN
jgi:transcription antitermination protein NusB